MKPQAVCSSTISGFLFACLLLFLLTGCVEQEQPGSWANSSALSTEKSGRLSLFLNLKKPDGPRSKMHILSLEVLSETGTWLPLSSSDIEAEPDALQSGQMFLTSSRVPIGYYNRLRIKTAPSPSAGSTEAVITELGINRPLYVASGDSHSLFLTWDIVASLAAGNTGNPVLSLNPRLKNMLIDVAYAACPDINTVFLICTDKNRVCDSLGVPGRPGYLKSDPIVPTANLYSSTEEDKNLIKIGPAANRVEAGFPLPTLGRGVQFTISPDGQWAFVVDKKRGNIVRLNLSSGTIDLRNRLGYEPSYIIYLEKQALVAVSLSRSQSVVLLDPESLQPLQTISTGNKPEGLLLYQDNYLYIAESGGNSVMVYNLSENRVQQRIPVGLNPKRLLAVNDRIYVTNSRSRSLSLVRPGQLGVSKTIRMTGPPLEMAYSSANKWLYVGNKATGAIDIIDPADNKITGEISLGAVPLGIAVLR